MILGLDFLRMQLRASPAGASFALEVPTGWSRLAIYLTTVMCVAIALKVLNNVRIEMKLEEQERLLLQARMEALQSQINPHFLFNTLNSVSSLVRFNPDKAREMIVKLSSILRRLLRKSDSFVQLKRGAGLHRRLSRHRSGALRAGKAADRERAGADNLEVPCPA